MMKKQILILSSLAAATGLALFVGSEAMSKYEEPDYEITKSKNGYEIRHYPPRLVAEVDVSGEKDACMSKGFRILAGYIFGKNRSSQNIKMTTPVTAEVPAQSEKIKMTVPVTANTGGESSWTIRFFMPEKYNLETLPEPIDNRIRLKELDSTDLAVLQFSGRSSTENFQKNAVKLKELLQNDSLSVEGKPITAIYNPPWTLPFMRRNEVMFKISQ